MSDVAMREYKGRKYGCRDGIWLVELSLGHEFIVGLDDTKLCGHRRFVAEWNNEESCRTFIDCLVDR